MFSRHVVCPYLVFLPPGPAGHAARGWWYSGKKEGEFAPSPAGKLCMTVPIILAAIYVVIRVMLYCIWLSDHAAEVRKSDPHLFAVFFFRSRSLPLVGFGALWCRDVNGAFRSVSRCGIEQAGTVSWPCRSFPARKDHPFCYRRTRTFVCVSLPDMFQHMFPTCMIPGMSYRYTS